MTPTSFSFALRPKVEGGGVVGNSLIGSYNIPVAVVIVVVDFAFSTPRD